jgi:hypothetical protein
MAESRHNSSQQHSWFPVVNPVDDGQTIINPVIDWQLGMAQTVYGVAPSGGVQQELLLHMLQISNDSIP